MTTRRDEGSVLLLTIGLFAVLLLLVGVVVDVSAAALDQRSLASAADGAAVEAAQQIDLGAFYARGLGGGVPLSPADVQDRVERYADAASADQPGLVMTSTVEDGHVAVVTATRTVRLPFGGWLDVGTLTLTSTARSRSPLVP